MSSNDDTQLVLRYLKATLTAARSGDFTAADELVAEDAAFHDPGPYASSSRSGHQRRLQGLVGAFTELEFDVHDLIGPAIGWSSAGACGGSTAAPSQA